MLASGTTLPDYRFRTVLRIVIRLCQPYHLFDREVMVLLRRLLPAETTRSWR
jgi:hypothetical protein